MPYPCPKCGRNLHKNGKTPAGKQRWICLDTVGGRTYCYATTNPKAKQRKQSADVVEEDPIPGRVLRKASRYIITCAQNATPIHKQFWASLLVAAKHYDAEIIVIPIRYKNATSQWTDSQENAEWWDAAVTPHLYKKRAKLNAHCVVLADISVQPTASDPLSGFQAMSAGESCIIGHPKMQLVSVPTPGHKMAKLLTTTGACTRPNYTKSRAGATGEFHHSLSALIVEIDGPKFWLRQLHGNKSSGSFTDLNKTFTPRGVRKAQRPLALVCGDTHVDFLSPSVRKATYDKGGMLDVLKPHHIVHHDLLDSYSISGHHVGNPFNAIAKRISNRDDARAEVMRAIEFVRKTTPKGTKAVIVSSNHDDMLRRWIIREDWKTNPTNAEFYLETALFMVRSTRMTEIGTEYASPLVYWGRKILPSARWLDGESFTLAGVELSLHGDKGPNGSRGSARNLRRIGPKVIIGHSHSPCISEGAYQTGTSTELKAEYTGPVGSWLNAHVVEHADGKRQLIIIIDGRWRK